MISLKLGIHFSVWDNYSGGFNSLSWLPCQVNVT